MELYSVEIGVQCGWRLEKIYPARGKVSKSVAR